MKTKILFFTLCSLLVSNLQFSQNITNTLGTNGLFTIKDGSTTYLSLIQSNGNININRSIRLPNTTNSTFGVIYKGAFSFLHDFRDPGGYGYNTFLGIDAGNFTLGSLGNAAGSYNTGVGNGSLHSLTNGYYNSAFGFQSLQDNTEGTYNSAFGVSSLQNNTIGWGNSAFGNSSLFFNTQGEQNSSFGLNSMYSNSNGSKNSAFGYTSMYASTTGYENTAVGHSSLYSNISGWQNTAVGVDALRRNFGGFQNTAVGHHSLNFNTGNYNTAIGYNSGSSVTTGYNLTLIGIDANPTSPTTANQITLGNIFVTSLRCNVTTITSLSDARDKKNVQDLPLGLEFISKLKPRRYNWDKREWYEDNISDGSKMQQSPTAGFIAQELDEAQTSAGAQWLNLVLKDNPEKWEATPGNLLPVMVKAIQELKAENDNLKAQVESFKTIWERLEKLEEKLMQNCNSVNVKMAEEK